MNAPLDRYNNVVTLDLSNRKFTPVTQPFRLLRLVSIRVILTILLEGIVFGLFMYRQKRSWLIFFAINLATQGALNLWLNCDLGIMLSSLILRLFVGEFFVFLAEMIAFPIFIQEHKKIRTVIYAFTANFVSLIAGGYIIMLLSV